jgi:TolB-like protein/DNA-binding winged helix-turn-helix (wHTH) protein/tetratricopeptide (TPR) repeat protein
VDVQTAAGIRFGQFLLDRGAGGLFRLDERGSLVPVSLGSRALDVLCVLVARAGELVAKQAIMDAVWPDTAVEENNLTVQISALRRVLDQERPEGSCIRTVPGRGYRFVVPVIQDDHHLPASDGGVEPSGDHVAMAAQASPPLRMAPRRHRRFRAVALAGLGLVVAMLLLFAGRLDSWRIGSTDRPRLSMVVLPFENLSGDARDDYLADGITDDLTSDLSHISGAFVIARQSAYAYKGKPRDVRKIGEELGVRYVLEGSVRQMGSTLRVNVQLTSGETGAHLWSDRFDEEVSDLAAGQEQIVTRMRSGLGISMVEIEKARGLREHPTSPDAFDMILRARSLQNQPPMPQRSREALALYERALLLDPSSAVAMANIAYFLLDSTTTGLGVSSDDLERAARLLMQARTIAPNSATVLNYMVYWLSSIGRCQEVIEAAQPAIRMDPNQGTGTYNELGKCKTMTGHAEEEISLQATAYQRDPHSAYRFRRFNRMGFASLMLGRDQDAITFYQRSLAMAPEAGGNQNVYRELAAAYARTGQMEPARQALAEADRLWPFDTVRSHAPEVLTSSVYVEQYRRYQDALRLAGERDHANEDDDFGVPTDAALHDERGGRTPVAAPGARTIRTIDLSRLLAEARPVVIDALANSWGRSIPGAIGLRFSGLGGSFADSAQERLRIKMRELTGGNVNRPIVTVGWNSERFDGRNLGMRLVALGYTRVYWYRGGREAWEVNGLPEAELNVQQW